MVWVLGSAIVTGITGDFRVAVSALLFLAGWRWRVHASIFQASSLLIMSIALAAYGHVSMATLAKDTEKIARLFDGDGAEVCLEGWVSSFPHYRYGGMSFEFKTRLEDNVSTVFVRTKEYLVSYGDSLRVCATLRTVDEKKRPGYSTYLIGKGVSGEIRVLPGKLQRLAGFGGHWVTRNVFWAWHDQMRQMVSRALGGRSGIPIALLLGERGYLDRKTAKAFVRLGVSHLLALSGLHLGFVTGFLLIVFRLLRRRNGLLLIVALGIYVGTVGFIISLYRAFLMAVLLVSASMVKRPMDPVKALANAFILILLLYPHAFFGIGFQLSFLATFGVLICVKALPKRRSDSRLGRFWGSIRSSFQISVAAQAFVAPVILETFGRMSLLSPLATLIFLVPVAFLLFFAAVCVTIGLIFQQGRGVFVGLHWVVVYFQKGLLAASDAVPDPLEVPPPDPFVFYAALTLFVVGRGKLWPKITGVCGILIAFWLPHLR